MRFRCSGLSASKPKEMLATLLPFGGRCVKPRPPQLLEIAIVIGFVGRSSNPALRNCSRPMNAFRSVDRRLNPVRRTRRANESRPLILAHQFLVARLFSLLHPWLRNMRRRFVSSLSLDETIPPSIVDI